MSIFRKAKIIDLTYPKSAKLVILKNIALRKDKKTKLVSGKKP